MVAQGVKIIAAATGLAIAMRYLTSSRKSVRKAYLVTDFTSIAQPLETEESETHAFDIVILGGGAMVGACPSKTYTLLWQVPQGAC